MRLNCIFLSDLCVALPGNQGVIMRYKLTDKTTHLGERIGINSSRPSRVPSFDYGTARRSRPLPWSPLLLYVSYVCLYVHTCTQPLRPGVVTKETILNLVRILILPYPTSVIGILASTNKLHRFF